MTGFVSNGNGTPGVLEYLRPWIDAYKVDLKSFDDRHYRELGGRLQPILDTIRQLHDMGIWLEIVTLLIPGFNDSDDELKRLTEFVASVSPDIPWHVTAFHGDYKMTDPWQHHAADAAARGGDRRGRRASIRLCGQSPRQGGRPRRHALPAMPRAAHRTLRVPHSRIQSHSCGRLPFLRHADSRTWSDVFTEQRTAFPIPLRLRAGSEPMIRDLLGRPLKNLRLSVTDRCNLRCSYCMPEAEYVWLPRHDILQFEEMSTLVDVFARAGVDRVRLTGGEPLLRRDLPELIRMIARKPAIRDLALTTNGVMLAEHARALHRRRPASPDGEPRHAARRSLSGAHALRFARRRCWPASTRR